MKNRATGAVQHLSRKLHNKQNPLLVQGVSENQMEACLYLHPIQATKS